MKLNELTLKGFLAAFVVMYCLISLSFLDLKEAVISLFSVLVTAIVSYYFGSSQGRAAQDRAILDLKNSAIADIGGSNDPKPDPKDK